MVAKKQMTYEELVETAKALRLKSERAEAEFFAFLLRAEADAGDVWREAGCATFEQFVRSNQLCEFDRYANFARGVERTSLEDALANGAHWAMQVGKMHEPSKGLLAQFSEKASAFLEVHNVAPSEKTVQSWARELAQPPGPTGAIRQVSELAQLRAKVQVLEAEARKLRKENERLSKQLSKYEPRPPTASA
jgi:hypothetical protein